MKPDVPVEAAVFMASPEAELARARLAAEGIGAVIAADDAGGMYPGMSIGRVRLLVRAEDLDRAQRVLRS